MSERIKGEPFRHHLPAFRGAPEGYARCRSCGVLFTDWQYCSEQCAGPPVEAEPVKPELDDPTCALCGAVILVAAEHREIVRLFGSTCASCFGITEAMSADATTEAIA